MNKIDWWNTYLGEDEISSVSKSISNKHIGMGPITKEFENRLSKLLKVPYVVATPSGSVSLYMALMILGIGKGDEVIVPDRTFIATAHAVQLTGAKVVLVDVNKKDTNINISKITSKITNNTKAIIAVHLNGRAVDMDSINEIAQINNLFVIEDTCQAIFSKNQNNEFLGTLSDIGCFSLGLSKLITVGYGGFIVCHSKDKYNDLIAFRNHGRIHEDTASYNKIGFNFKVSDMIMSIGIMQLLKYKTKIEHCKIIYLKYKEFIDTASYIELIHVNIENEVPLYVEVISKYKNKLVALLENSNIYTNNLPPSLHLSKHLSQENFDFNNSIYFDNYSFILPCGPNQSIDNIDRTIKVLKGFKNAQ